MSLRIVSGAKFTKSALSSGTYGYGLVCGVCIRPWASAKSDVFNT
jgi:hypothetical protein